MLAEDLDPWQGKLAVLTLNDGESSTAHIIEVDTKRDEIVVDILDSNRPYPGRDQRAFTLATGRILSVRPAPSGMHPRRPVPSPDLCRQPSPLTGPRFVILALLFLTFIPGSVIVFFLLINWRYGLQLASLIGYTAAVTLYTFSSNSGGNRPYLFDCPIVRRQFPHLLRRHVGFLAALLIIQTTALQLRPHLPANWITASGRDETPFTITLTILCVGLAIAQILSNRSLLENAHLKFTPPDAAA